MKDGNITPLAGVWNNNIRDKERKNEIQKLFEIVTMCNIKKKFLSSDCKVKQVELSDSEQQ